MITVPDFEIAVTSIAGQDNTQKPIVALSFAWSSAGSSKNPVWSDDTSTLQVKEDGLLFSLPDTVIFFPWNTSETKNPDLLDGPAVIELIASHGGLFVCAFDDAGDLVESIGFLDVSEKCTAPL